MTSAGYGVAGRVNMADSFKDRPPRGGIVGKPKKVGNNRFMYKREDGAAVYRLRHTDIVILHKDGRIELNSGGWRTVTTKAAMNEFASGYSVTQDKGVWYVGRRGNWDHIVPFYDGMILPDALDEKPADVTKQKDLAKAINAFVSQVDTKGYEPPNHGDCWFCLFLERDNPANGNSEHLLSHIEEGYLPGSLIVNALKWAGYKDFAIPVMFTQKGAVKRALRRFLRRRLELG